MRSLVCFCWGAHKEVLFMFKVTGVRLLQAKGPILKEVIVHGSESFDSKILGLIYQTPWQPRIFKNSTVQRNPCAPPTNNIVHFVFPHWRGRNDVLWKIHLHLPEPCVTVAVVPLPQHAQYVRHQIWSPNIARSSGRCTTEIDPWSDLDSKVAAYHILVVHLCTTNSSENE